jgi:curli biogenesis system outer membrane secretion channel CsgG
MRRFIWLVCLAIFATIAPAQQKKRVAVFDFEYGTVQSSSAAIFGTNVDVGKGIADLMVDNLVRSGVYSVIERKALDKVDAIIIGSVTEFGRDDKATNVGAGGFGGIGRKYGIGGVSKRESKAVVALSARMVNVDTAEILAVASGKGESTRGGTSLLGAGGGSGAGGGGAYDFTSSNFGATILGEAVTQAVRGLSGQLDQQSAKLTMTTRTVEIDGLVADATGGTLILNVGTKAGVKVGDHLKISRAVREVRDPGTGKVIRRVEDKIGEVVINEADEGSSVGAYTGSTPAKVGDRVANLP